jgi:hypothetical protein
MFRALYIGCCVLLQMSLVSLEPVPGVILCVLEVNYIFLWVSSVYLKWVSLSELFHFEEKKETAVGKVW